MKKDIERGNIAATAAKRKYSFDHAATLIDPINRARRALALIGKRPSNAAIADKLNQTGYRSSEGALFHKETVRRLLKNTERMNAEAAITECEIEVAIIDFEFRQLAPDQQGEGAAAHIAAIKVFHQACLETIIEGVEIGRQLRAEEAMTSDALLKRAVELETDVRAEMGKSGDRPTLYAQTVLSRSHERRKRADIKVRRAREKARVAARHEQLGLELE